MAEAVNHGAEAITVEMRAEVIRTIAVRGERRRGALDRPEVGSEPAATWWTATRPSRSTATSTRRPAACAPTRPGTSTWHVDGLPSTCTCTAPHAARRHDGGELHRLHDAAGRHVRRPGRRRRHPRHRSGGRLVRGTVRDGGEDGLGHRRRDAAGHGPSGDRARVRGGAATSARRCSAGRCTRRRRAAFCSCTGCGTGCAT